MKFIQMSQRIMELFTTFFILCMSGLRSSNGKFPEPDIFNVINYGAVGDGATNDSNAFLAAWAAACGAVLDTPVLCIPDGQTFLLTPLRFQGPCNSSNIFVYVQGNIVAPSDIKAWNNLKNWIVFSNVNGLIVKGSGQIDGKGSVWWNQSNQPNDSIEMNSSRPAAMEFEYCHNFVLSGLTYINSPRSHVNIYGCTGVTINNLHITAPATSPNTDGIDIGKSSNLQIHDCVIGTGDDCIAISGGSSKINITGVACGPGHGISIGSLGAMGKNDQVEEVQVKDCSFTRTQNGVRIKTWQGGSGYARKIYFIGITFNAANNPIIIDQFYCPHSHCSNQFSAVKISDIIYRRVQGTSIKAAAITLNCSQTVPCTNIILDHVNIISTCPKQPTYANCIDARGSSSSTFPVVNCLLT